MVGGKDRRASGEKIRKSSHPAWQCHFRKSRFVGQPVLDSFKQLNATFALLSTAPKTSLTTSQSTIPTMPLTELRTVPLLLLRNLDARMTFCVAAIRYPPHRRWHDTRRTMASKTVFRNGLVFTGHEGATIPTRSTTLTLIKGDRMVMVVDGDSIASRQLLSKPYRRRGCGCHD